MNVVILLVLTDPPRTIRYRRYLGFIQFDTEGQCIETHIEGIAFLDICEPGINVRRRFRDVEISSELN